MKVKISMAQERFGVNVWVYDEKEGYREVWEPIDISVKRMALNSGDHIEPTFKLDEGTGFLEALSEALIEAGYRDKTVSKDGEIVRLESHLDDMRKIAYKKLGMSM